LARAAQAGEPDADALTVARRVRLGKDLGDLGAGEPLRQAAGDVEELLAHLSTGEARRLLAVWHARDLHIAVILDQVDQVLDAHRADTQLVGVLGYQLLGLVGAVEWLALRVLARPGV